MDAPRPLIGHVTLRSASQSEEQFQFARMRLQGLVVTDSPASSTMSIISSSGGSSREAKSESALGLAGTYSRLDSHEATALSSSFEILASRPSSAGEFNSPSKATGFGRKEPSGESGAERDTARELHFADALARIEGRVPPNPSTPTPIQRFVHSEQLYSDNVVLEHSSPVLRCPRPIRWANHLNLEKLFQIDRFDEPELPGHPAQDEPLERPENPTPDRAIFHNEE